MEAYDAPLLKILRSNVHAFSADFVSVCWRIPKPLPDNIRCKLAAPHQPARSCPLANGSGRDSNSQAEDLVGPDGPVSRS